MAKHRGSNAWVWRAADHARRQTRELEVDTAEVCAPEPAPRGAMAFVRNSRGAAVAAIIFIVERKNKFVLIERRSTNNFAVVEWVYQPRCQRTLPPDCEIMRRLTAYGTVIHRKLSTDELLHPDSKFITSP